jgi:2-polyprenyl-3-methyl-5-hydroxy-6-metoxy-1,4-benzoquinol methylase
MAGSIHRIGGQRQGGGCGLKIIDIKKKKWDNLRKIESSIIGHLGKKGILYKMKTAKFNYKNIQLHAIKKFRKICFNKIFPIDEELNKLIDVKQIGNKQKKMESHSFIKNPVSQNIFIYLIEYLISFSRQWFGLEDMKILDWGCGKGHISYLLNKRNVTVISCDLEVDNADSAFGQYVPIIENGNIEVVPLKHPYKLPFENDSFDVVLSFGVLEHVQNDFESLCELRRILKPHGLLFCFYLPYVYSYTQKIARIRGSNYHDRLYNKRKIEELLQKSNMELLDVWHRAIFPKNSVKLPLYHLFEKVDAFICSNTPLKHFATNIEFVAYK